MHPYQHARTSPDRLALVVGDTGERLTYRQLDEQSNRGAHLLRKFGLKPGDRIGLMARNGPVFPIAYWAAQRSGVVLIPISTHLKPAEVAHILNDSGARLFITSADLGDTVAELAADRANLIPEVVEILSVGGDLAGASSFERALASPPATPISDQISGYYMVYSSGTTGRPKGIAASFAQGPIEEENAGELVLRRRLEGLDPLVTLEGGPLYHAFPFVTMIATHRLGGTSVVFRKFDALNTLRAIQDWTVTHAQFVPTMFARMLALPDEDRQRFDLSSLTHVVHSGAPCPPSVKHAMIGWLGPILHEYYSGSERIGQCYISSQEWLQRPGSVGRPLWGVVRICDESGKELPVGQEGLIYFDAGRSFEYINDAEKTAKSRHPKHADWSTMGDIGRLDEDGYVFITDRKDFMIISGGVNIYPQIVENALIAHPKVLDAAVIGVPNEEYGEEVKAIVQPVNWPDAGDALEQELIGFCRETISRLNCPRSVEFLRELPRMPSGKLAKHELRRRFLSGSISDATAPSSHRVPHVNT